MPSKPRPFKLVINRNGQILLPRELGCSLAIAKALGDEKAISFCEQAEKNKVLVGKGMCG